MIEALEAWLREKLADLSRMINLAEVIRHALSRWAGLSLLLNDERVEIDSNTVERGIRPVALNRKNALFAGPDGGGEHWAMIATLIETCNLVGVEPQAYPANVTIRIAQGYPQRRLYELLPWAYPATPTLTAMAWRHQLPCSLFGLGRRRPRRPVYTICTASSVAASMRLS